MPSHLVLIRHGQTEWTVTGRHTGRSDIPLTKAGREQAAALGEALAELNFRFQVVLTSPAIRAKETANLAGYSGAEVVIDLEEWDYGSYEGRRATEIRQEVPGWTVWTHPPTDGESLADVGARADRVIDRISKVAGDVALFGHGHALRVLAVRWLRLSPIVAAGLVLETGAISVLGWEREHRAIHHWNDVCHLRADTAPERSLD